MSTKVYEIVTEKIIAEMEKGIIPWKKPWTGVSGGAYSHATGKPYSLLNQWMLQNAGEYLTFKQVQNEGGRIRKGSKAEMIFFFKPYTVTDTDKDGKQVEKIIPLLRYYNVFHISQCEGIKPRFSTSLPIRAFNPIEDAEKIASEFRDRESMPIQHILHDQAFYSPRTDSVTMPLQHQFFSVAEYYSTLFHELAHSTGSEKRLKRFDASSALTESKEDYSLEELVAEISSATILATLGIETPSSIRNSVAYIQNWIKVFQNDKKMIITASIKAEKAVALIVNPDQTAADAIDAAEPIPA